MAATQLAFSQIPGVRQIALLIGIAAAVAVGVLTVQWSRAPSYELLYANLEEKDAGQVAQVLQSSNIPYQLGGGGSSIFAPAGEIASLRLKLAAQGLPRGNGESAGVGADGPFGLSDFAEKARHQQNLEKDLGNTIASLQSVKSARVHLALPKPSAFIHDRRAASASVVLTLYPGRQVDDSQVAAIVHLVASSVTDLDSRQVSVIDQKGQLLTSNDASGSSAISDNRFRLVQRIENAYAARIEELLTPFVGTGGVRAQVVAHMDFTETEKTSEVFDHEHPALRSEQVNREQRGNGGQAEGIPGALSNQPPVTPAQPTAANPTPAGVNAKTEAGEISNSSTRNFEVDRTISHTREPTAAIRRLTVAVALDNKSSLDDNNKSVSTPFNKAELDQMTELVKNTVGFDSARGDNVSVVNAPFHTEPAAAEPASLPLWEQPSMREFFKQGLGAALALILMFAVVRPALRGLVMPIIRAPELLPLASGLDDPTSARLALSNQSQSSGGGSNSAKDPDQTVALAKRMVNQDPKQVAQVVKSWVAEDGG